MLFLLFREQAAFSNAYEMSDLLVAHTTPKKVYYLQRMNPSLKEKYIQTTAVKYLAAQYYRGCSHNGVIEYKLEATTKANKRADGIIVWEKSPKQVRLVSVEAKSATTLHNLKSRWNKKKLSKASLIAAEIIVFLLFIPLFALFKIQLTLDGPLLFLLLVFIYWFTIPTRKFLERFLSNFFQTASIFEQVNLYPGNEVWIAIGYDTFKIGQEQKREAFILQCKQRKLGLIEVYPESQLPTVLLHPTFKPAYKVKDFLAYYKVGEKLRKSISKVSNASPFSSNRSRAERFFYMKNFSSAFLLVSILFILAIPFSLPSSNKTASKYELSTTRKQTTIPPTYQQDQPITRPTIKRYSAPTPTPEAPTVEQSAIEALTIEQLCASFALEKQKYLIQDQIVYSIKDAEKRVAFLKSLRFKQANYFFIPCSDMSHQEAAFLVYPYNPRSHRNKTAANLGRYQYIMRTNEYEYGQAKILLVGKKEVDF